ncbi:DUF2236 domain-containing protein [Hanstruepera neustonica]|uniref:DUF2236 domain-containing protein n=1 Tax=Hanstruepera neustonica TaxID=1445657 RepID=A0A2K1E0E3_9FLAO|nr:oxygenase MpaB family protein [Hanstruepera neustonica]PNQ73760.1 DUF2236 domain-containing protein [Hanstruepera neustonica]
MAYFTQKDSIVRTIWGNSDTILLIFAGASAEFALNKAVDWLYYTGRLPNDPLGRLFSTVAYARQIVFSEESKAKLAIKNINNIHQAVETKREQSIPNWAYKDVLFMLIDYSIRSYELLERPLKLEEKEEVFSVFHKVGTLMNIHDLPKNYQEFKVMRSKHLQENLLNGPFTKDLYKQYCKHLGRFRYQLLKEAQIMLLPNIARKQLKFRRFSFLSPLIPTYKLSKTLKLDNIIKHIILPSTYMEDIKSLNFNSL